MDLGTKVVIAVGALGAIAPILERLENSQWLRAWRPNVRVFATMFNVCLIVILMMGVVRLSDLGHDLDKLSNSLKEWKAAQSTPTQITPDNIETKIRAWLDTFGLTTQKVVPLPDPNLFFMMRATTKGNNHILIFRIKPFDRYINLQSAVELGSAHKTIFEKLSADQLARFQRELTLEIVKAKISFESLPTRIIVLKKAIPITNNLTEDSFIERFDELEFATALVSQTIGASLERFAKPGSLH